MAQSGGTYVDDNVSFFLGRIRVLEVAVNRIFAGSIYDCCLHPMLLVSWNLSLKNLIRFANLTPYNKCAASYHRVTTGGHFATRKQPKLFTEELPKAFRWLR